MSNGSSYIWIITHKLRDDGKYGADYSSPKHIDLFLIDIKKTILLAVILLCGSGCFKKTPEGGLALPENEAIAMMHKDGFVSFEDIKDEDEYACKVKLNNETVTKIPGFCSINAYSLKNGLLTVAATETDKALRTLMYTIDLENKAIIKKELLDVYRGYKDSDFELSITSDGNKDINKEKDVMRYIRKSETHEVVLPKKVSREIYISKDGYIVFATDSDKLYVYSMDKKKFTHLGETYLYSSYGALTSSGGWYIPLNEYVIYCPRYSRTPPLLDMASGTLANVYIYYYAKEELYATHYQNVLEELRDIDAGIKNEDLYKQFLPLTRVANIDSVAEKGITGCSDKCSNELEREYKCSEYNPRREYDCYDYDLEPEECSDEDIKRERECKKKKFEMNLRKTDFYLENIKIYGF